MVSLRALVTAALLPLVTALTAQDIVKNIETLTNKTDALQAPAQSITILNAPLIVIGKGPLPVLITGFTDIGTTAAKDNEAMSADNTHITSAGDAQLVVDAFKEFVRVYQELLDILIGKAGFLTSIPYVGEPIVAALRELKVIVDPIVDGLINVIEPPDQKANITDSYNSLGARHHLAVNKFEGLQLKKIKRVFVA